MSNSNNQKQRSKAGVKVIRAKRDAQLGELRRVDNQLAKAADIEAQLGALASKKTPGNDDKSYKLRSHLCELLSDVLISSPTISLERDCFQRLWRGCFYNPIRIWRQRVSREKRKRSPSLAATQEGFKHFLSEAVALYDYLVLQYLTKLVPSTTQQQDNMTQQTRDSLSTLNDRSQLEDTQYASQSTTANHSLSSDTLASSDSSLEGVVHGLYKLYIFLGDLHRYAEAYNKAEANYLNASKLGPGLGNPYNQLAVVAFSRDAYCVALYWYARSLLATHEKFSTSSNNLERLFVSNREFLAEHGRGSAPTVFQNTASINKGKNRNSANQSMLRAQKAAAVKSCLTYFVDLHYDLYQEQKSHNTEQPTSDESTNNANDADDPKAQRLREKMNNVIASLKSLIVESGFSDALLCKIVVINSFSLERAGSVTTSGDTSKPNNWSKSLAQDYFFSLGLVLAEQVERLLFKSLQKVAPNRPAPSVRCLLPFEMLLEFVAMRLAEDCNNNNNDDNSSIQIEFWKRVSVVGNLVQKIVKSYKIGTVAGNNQGTTDLDASSCYRQSASPTQIKEYQLLKGYRPFGIVNEEYTSNGDGFLGAMETVNVLELSTAPSTSQDTGTTSAVSEDGGSTGGGGVRESKAKLLRMLELCRHLALPASVAPLVLENGNYSYQENSSLIIDKSNMENGDDREEEDSVGGNNYADDSDDDASDIIVFNEIRDQPSKPSGLTAPSPSVAGADSLAEKSSEAGEATNGDDVMTVAEEESPPPISTSVIKPPPGFGDAAPKPPAIGQTRPAVATGEPLMDHHLTSVRYNPSIDLPGLPSPPKKRNILDQVIQGRIPAAELSQSSLPLPQQQLDPSILPLPGLSSSSSSNSARNEILYSSQSGRSNLPTSVEESIRIFGDMKTTNPFVVDPPSSAFSVPINNHQNQNIINQDNSIFPNYVSEDGFTSDDTKWLNSNLLNSLWMSESANTNNS